METSETETEWRLKGLAINLTAKEREWFEWARDGAKEVLGDEDWLADNDDALTVEGQILDMRYRLETQAYEMLNSAGAFGASKGADRRVLDALNAKLEKSGYWNADYHSE